MHRRTDTHRVSVSSATDAEYLQIKQWEEMEARPGPAGLRPSSPPVLPAQTGGRSTGPGLSVHRGNGGYFAGHIPDWHHDVTERFGVFFFVFFIQLWPDAQVRKAEPQPAGR